MVEPGDAPSWASAELPAGSYDASAELGRVLPGTLLVRVGRSLAVWRELPLPAGHPRAEFTLPSGAREVRVEPGPAVASATRWVDLTPMSLARGTPRLARDLKALGPAWVWFFDENVFIEPEAVWVRGASTTSFGLTSEESRLVGMVVTNGGAVNDVSVETEAGTYTMALEPHAARRIEARVQAGRLSRIQVRSETGFRPAEVEDSRDWRYLGVRIQFTD